MRKLARKLARASAIADIALNAIGVAALLPLYLFPHFLAYASRASAALLLNKWRLRLALGRYGIPPQLVNEVLQYYEDAALRILFPWLTALGAVRGFSLKPREYFSQKG